MEVSDKIIIYLKKIKALADKGIGGEKENASLILSKLLLKYKITLEELEEDKIERHTLKFFEGTISLGVQIIALTLDTTKVYNDNNSYKLYYSSNERDHIEIQEKYLFYYRAYKEELKVFMKAFIHRNDLYRIRHEEEEYDSSPLTLEEKQEAFRIQEMSTGIERKIFNKRLNK